MGTIIWIVPFFIFLLSTYFFNNKRPDRDSVNIKLWTLLDTIILYSFTMIFVSQMLVKPIFINVILVLVFLISGILRFWNDKVRSNDFDLELETIKNSLTFYLTTFIPFLIFIFILKDITVWIQFPLSICIAFIVFYVSLHIKKHIVKIIDKITLQSQLVTDLSLSIIYYLVIVVTLLVLMIVFVFTRTSRIDYNVSFDKTFIPAFVDTSNEFDWQSIDLLDIASPSLNYNYEEKSELTALIRDENNIEYIVMFYNIGNSSENTPYLVYHELLGSTQSNTSIFDKTSKFVYNNQNFVTPSTGLYTYSSTGADLVPGTEGYPVKIIKCQEDETCFLIDNLDGTYKVINSSLDELFTIDNLSSNERLVIISSHLFIEDENNLKRYDNPEISFVNHNGYKQYNELYNQMITSTSDNYGVSIIRESSTNTIKKHFFINGKYEVQPLLNGYIYNPTKLYSEVHKEMLEDDLYIYSYEIENDDWISLAVYNPNTYLVEEYLQSSIIKITMFETNRSYNIYNINYFDVQTSHMVNSKDEWRVVTLLIVLSTFFIFVPITDHRSSIKVIGFESEVINKTLQKNKKQ